MGSTARGGRRALGVREILAADLLREAGRALLEGRPEEARAGLLKGLRYFPEHPELTRFLELLVREPEAARRLAGGRAPDAGPRPWSLSRIPKKAHFYWGNEGISFLRYLSVASFRKLNPDWEIHLYLPTRGYRGEAPWITGESYEGAQAQGRDYARELFGLPGLHVHEVDFEAFPAVAAAAETYKSDFFRWHRLAEEGGLYSDIDILYIRPMADLHCNHEGNGDLEAALCLQEYGHIIGFFLAAPGNPLFRQLAERCEEGFDTASYQSLGSQLMNRLYPSEFAIRQQHPLMRWTNLPMGVVYAYDHLDLGALFESEDLSCLRPETLGLHWYAGSPLAQRHNRAVDSENYVGFRSVLGRMIRSVHGGEPLPEGLPWARTWTRERPRFSILVPTYNQADFLKATLDSLLAQTVQEWEAVVMNDGSRDHTAEVLADYGARDPRIRAFHQENGGVASALNGALREAKGEWICWLSSDDLYEPDALEIFAQAIERTGGAQFFYSNFFQLFDETGEKRPIPEGRGKDLPIRELQTISFFTSNYVNGISICIAKALFDRVGCFDESLRYAQDFDMWLRMSAVTQLHFIDRRPCVTRVHPGQDSAGFKEAGDYDSARACLGFLNKNRFGALFPFLDLRDPANATLAVQAALRVALNPQSWIYSCAGFVPALLERLGEWLGQDCPQEVSADLLRSFQPLSRQLGGLPEGLRAAFAKLAQEGELRYLPREPVAAVVAHYRASLGAGPSPASDLLDRYLRKVIRIADPVAWEPEDLPSVPPPGPAEAPTFTILVPTCNQDAYLPATLASLRAQSRGDWEAVVVDDGSIDGTRRVLAQLAARDPRIRVMHKANGGVATALNEALRHARGAWICWLSSDDLLVPEALETFASEMRLHPEAQYFHADYAELLQPSGKLRLSPPDRATGLPSPERQVVTFFRGNYVHGISVCIRRSLFEAVGPFREDLRYAQDMDQWLRMAARTRLHYVPRRLCTTRVHASMGTRQFPEAGGLDSARACLDFLNAHPFEALFPALDLGTREGALEAVRATLDVVLDPQAFMYFGVGPVPALLERLGEWLGGGCPAPLRSEARREVAALTRGKRDLPPPLREALASIEGGRAPRYQPRDPLAEMARNVQVRDGAGLVHQAGFLRRYLAMVGPGSGASAASGPAEREGFLFEPDFRGAEWVEVVLAYLEAFAPGDPVGLLLPFAAGREGQLTLPEAEQALLQVVARTGREAFPDIVLVEDPEELLPALRGFASIQRVPSGKGRVEGLEGPLGERLAQARRRLCAV